MRKMVFLIIASLLVIMVVLPGCDGYTITIAICGPMGNVQGVHMWYGAMMAADEINALNGGQGIDIGGAYYKIKVVNIDTNEIASPASAGPLMEAAITSQKAQFVIGGVRTEAVVDMVKVAGNTTTPFFICGAATYSLLAGTGHYYVVHAGTPYYPYEPDSAGYKYVFRGTPFNDIFLMNNTLLMTTMVAKEIETIIGANSTNKVEIAILSEGLTWADAMTESARLIIGTVAPYVFGWPWALANPGGNNGAGVWRVSDNPTTEEMNSILGQIKTSGAHIIFTILSGPVGVTYGKCKGNNDIPAISVGINVEGQDPGYWNKTKGSGTEEYGAAWEITTGTWAPGVNQTSKTAEFLENYAAYTGGLFPVYTASSYDAVWTIAKALEAVDVIETYDAGDPDQDAVITWLEDPANAQLISTGTSAYYQLWNGTTKGAWKSGTTAVWPALNSTQRDYWYSTLGFDAGCNFTMPPYTTHDLVYGPGYLTGLAVQWQGGVQIGVWPNNGTWTDQNTMSRRVAGINWTNVQYPGITDFIIPAWMCTAWGGSC